jgi:hypothetical protein
VSPIPKRPPGASRFNSLLKGRNDEVRQGEDRDGSAQSDAKKGAPHFHRKGGAGAPPSKFVGQCDGIKGKIYGIGEHGRPDLYVQTTEHLINHVGTSFGEVAIEIKKAIEELNNPLEALVKPAKPDKPDEFSIHMWKEDDKEYRKEKAKLTVRLGKRYSTVWGQCTGALQEKIKSDKSEFEAANNAQDCVALLELVKKWMYSSESSKLPPYVAVFEACKAAINFFVRGLICRSTYT